MLCIKRDKARLMHINFAKLILEWANTRYVTDYIPEHSASRRQHSGYSRKLDWLNVASSAP